MDRNMEQVYQEHAQTVYKFLLAQTRNADLAEELTQETFYQAVRSIDRFDGSCKISVWLCQIAKHMLYQHLRRNSKEVVSEESSFDVPLPSAEDEALARQEHIALLQKIHQLKEQTREVIYLRSFGGLSFREIGAVMGRSEAWARVTFYRGKEQLKGDMENES